MNDNAEDLRARFRAFREAYIDTLPARRCFTICEQCGRPMPRFEIKVIGKLEAENRECFGTWQKINGVWCVRVSGTRRSPRKPGDIVRARSKDGQLTLVLLGEKVSPGVFANAGTVSESA